MRKVVKSLTFPETMNVHQKDIQKYLTTNLRNADTSVFVPQVLGRKINIDFTQIQGLQRKPVANMCGCVLELSVHYDSYPDFSSKMNRVLGFNV